MKIEYLEKTGDSEFPFILRLFEFSTDEIIRLKAGLEELRQGKFKNFQLHKQDYVIPIANCCLTFEIGKTDKGIFCGKNKLEFNCILRDSAYQTMIKLLEPFYSKPIQLQQNTYQWLVERKRISNIALLISSSGQW